MAYSQPQFATDPLYRKVHRVCLAGCVILAPAVVFLGFTCDPTGGVPPPPAEIFAAYQAANPLKIQLLLFFNALTPYVLPLSFLGLARLAMRRAPWLATLGLVCGLIGTLPFGVFVWPEALGDAMIKVGNRATFVSVWNAVSSENVIIFLQYSWVIGHLLGYLLLGIALARGRVIPRWAASLIVCGLPLQAVAYMTHQGMFQLVSYLLILLGSVPAALHLVKEPSQNSMAFAQKAKE